MEQIEYSIIIEFHYGLAKDEPFFELDEQFRQRMEQAEAPGKFDGNEISMDNFDARFYFYSYNPQATLAYIEDLFPNYPFLKGARILIRQGTSEDAYTDTEILDQTWKRTALSRFDADQLSHIPEWNDHQQHYTDSEPGDEWRNKIKNERAEKLYNKWKEIDYLIDAIWDKRDLSAPETLENETPDDEDDEDSFRLPKDMIEWHRQEMRGNSYLIPAKISGAEAGDLYIIRMENAAIIRKAAMDVYLDCHMLTENGSDAQDIELLRSEIRLFRQLFIDWVNGFEKDDFEDEWGLFV